MTMVSDIVPCACAENITDKLIPELCLSCKMCYIGLLSTYYMEINDECVETGDYDTPWVKALEVGKCHVGAACMIDPPEFLDFDEVGWSCEGDPAVFGCDVFEYGSPTINLPQLKKD